MSLPALETERLVIRPLTADDVEACHRLYVDISWSDASPAARERRRKWVEWSARNYEQLADLHQPPYGDRALTLKSGQFVGLVGYVPLLAPFKQLPMFGGVERSRFSAQVGLFWAIATDHQRRGYATEAARALIDHAFECLALEHIVATTEHDNHSSIAVMQKLQMRIARNPYSEPAWFQTVGVLSADRAADNFRV